MSSEAKPSSAAPERKDIALAAEPSIHIAVDCKGNILLETVGTTGQECDYLVGALAASLGQISSRVNKECYVKQQVQ